MILSACVRSPCYRWVPGRFNAIFQLHSQEGKDFYGLIIKKPG